MAFYDGRGDDGTSWQDDDWDGLSVHEQEQEDALFKSLDEDELEDAHESRIDNLFSMQPMDMPLDLVERLSWDATSQGSGDEDEGVADLPLQDSTASEDNNVQWSLISPCPETSLSPLIRVSISSPVCQLRLSEPEHEVTEEQVKASTQQMIEEGEEEQEEVTLHEPETCWSPDANSVLSSPVVRVSANPFATYRSAESAEINNRPTDDAMSNGDEDNQQSPVISELRPSLLPRVPSIAHWRRQKTRTCSGVGSAGTPTVLSPATFKASLSRSRNRSVVDEDDGDFSSDDEGYTPELHRCRASETERLDVRQWRRARHMSINLPSHLNVSMNPAIMTKRLQEAKDKLNNGLNLLRSGSNVSTVMSEESYLESPVYQEIKSAPAGIYREPSIFSDVATSTSLVSASACTIDSDTHHPTRQQQLRAGVFRAAGFFNAASAEAARKLKSRGFRASRQKAASETEEEDLDLSTYPTASDQSGTLEVADIKYE